MIVMSIISLVLFLIQVALMVVSALLYKPPRQQKQKPSFTEFRLAATKIGMAIPATFGHVRLGGNIVEWGDWQVIRNEERTEMGGKK